jgi:hypothetical protein
MEGIDTGFKPQVRPLTKSKGHGIFAYLLVLFLGIAGGISIVQQEPAWFGLSPGASATQAQIDETVAKVGKLIMLPTDEKPTIATVTDATKVKAQAFFQNANNGDVVLIYTKAQEAILYDPAENKIIEVGAVNIGNQGVQTVTPAPASPRPSPSPKK